MILLDTHVWIWWISNPNLLSQRVSVLIDKAIVEKKIYLSSMSVWEVAMLVSKGRLQLAMEVRDWIRASEMLPFIQFIPVNNTIALRAVHLPEKFLLDPVDRILIATALELDLVLISKDKKMQKAARVKTVW